MLNPDEVKAIAKKFANKKTLDDIAKEAYEAHREVLRAAGVTHLVSWEATGFIVQSAWAMAIATCGEQFIEMCADVANEVRNQHLAKKEAKDGSG